MQSVGSAVRFLNSRFWLVAAILICGVLIGLIQLMPPRAASKLRRPVTTSGFQFDEIVAHPTSPKTGQRNQRETFRGATLTGTIEIDRGSSEKPIQQTSWSNEADQTQN